MSDWMNQADVRTALHIPSFAPAWTMCWGEEYNYQLAQEASMWIYGVLAQNGIRMMHYSGDTDGAVPTYGTKRWIEKLNLPLKSEWRQWHFEEQVTGFITQYEGLDFITVKGVGHMAPQWAKPAVWYMINHWIDGQDIL